MHVMYYELRVGFLDDIMIGCMLVPSICILVVDVLLLLD
jgi:hypothetical protein